VLTLVELLRELMERQALRRIDAGGLTAEEVERLGRTFLALAERMEELKDVFGLRDEDLNLDLGPLGRLMYTNWEGEPDATTAAALLGRPDRARAQRPLPEPSAARPA
jgi:hypothetical protein